MLTCEHCKLAVVFKQFFPCPFRMYFAHHFHIFAPLSHALHMNSIKIYDVVIVINVGKTFSNDEKRCEQEFSLYTGQNAE